MQIMMYAYLRTIWRIELTYSSPNLSPVVPISRTRLAIVKITNAVRIHDTDRFLFPSSFKVTAGIRGSYLEMKIRDTRRFPLQRVYTNHRQFGMDDIREPNPKNQR